PLMAATLAGPRRAASAVPGRDRLQCRETVQRLESLFAAVTRFAHASEWQLTAPARALIVEEHLARAQRLGEPHLPPPVGRPDTGNQTVAGPIGDRRGLGLVIEGNDDLDRAEDFLLSQAMAGWDIGEQGRGKIMSSPRRVLDDLCGGR